MGRFANGFVSNSSHDMHAPGYGWMDGWMRTTPTGSMRLISDAPTSHSPVINDALATVVGIPLVYLAVAGHVAGQTDETVQNLSAFHLPRHTHYPSLVPGPALLRHPVGCQDLGPSGRLSPWPDCRPAGGALLKRAIAGGRAITLNHYLASARFILR